jgi:hypothetical protein
MPINEDNDLYDNPEHPERHMTIRDKMGELASEYFFPRWERSAADRRREELEAEERERQRQEQEDDEAKETDNDNGNDNE